MHTSPSTSAPRPGPLRAASWVSAALGGCVGVAFVVNAQHYRFLSDDAFISYRYSRHLVDGLGLVWNPGQAVEGYTNFLWVLIVAAGLRLGIAPEVLTGMLGLASGLAILTLLAAFAARRWGWQDPLIWLAPGGLALSRTYTAWSSGGLETQFFSLLVLLGLLAVLWERERGVERAWVSSLVLGVATLTRPEGGLFALAAGLCLLGDVARRRRTLRSLALWTVPFVLLVGAHWLWRRGYYGTWLPNTFTAKVNGFWWEQGRRYLALFFAEYPLWGFAPLVLWSLARRRNFAAALFGSSAALYLLYLAAIGGGHIGFRFLVPVLPLLYGLAADGIHALVEIPAPRPGARWALAGAATALAAALLAATHWGSLHPAPRENSNGIGTTADADGYARLRIAQGRALRALVDRGRLPADLRIETGAAGALPYYTDWWVLDKRGLNDAQVARQPLARRGAVGHEHTASLAYVREHGVAVVLLGHRLLYEIEPGDLPRSIRVAQAWMQIYNAAARAPRDRLRLECREVEAGAYLIFGTHLDAERLEAVLGPLPRCPERSASEAPGAAKIPRSSGLASKHASRKSAIFAWPAGVGWMPSPEKYSRRTARRGRASKRAARSQSGASSAAATSRTIST
jgi:arabinofuranosyltransferase